MSSLILKSTLFTLPSQGKYDMGASLVGNDSLHIRPLLKGDQKVISTPGNTPYMVLFSLLDRVITDRPAGLDLNRMLLSDAVATLFAVRLMSFGSRYRVQYQCSNCNHFNEVSLDLREVEVKYAEDIPDFAITGHEIELEDGTRVQYHLPTLGDERSITAQVKNLTKKTPEYAANPGYLANLVRMTQLCDAVIEAGADEQSEQSFVRRMRYFDEKLSMADEKRIWNAIYERDVGLVPENEHACSACGFENAVMLNIDSNFFRPTDSK